MTDFDPRKAQLVQWLLDAVRRGELSRDVLVGFLMNHLMDHQDAASEAAPSETIGTQGGRDAVAGEESRGRTTGAPSGADPAELREQGRRELVELLKVPSDERPRLVERTRDRFRNPFLADELICEARHTTPRSPADALGLARLAVAVAHRIDVELHGADRRLETLARASAYEANALRVRDDLEAADRELDFARRCLPRVGKATPLVAAELDGLLASLRADQRRFPEAQEILDQVIVRYLAHGETGRAAHFLLKKGLYLHYEGRSEEALTSIAAGRDLVTPEEDAWLCLCAEHQLALVLCDTGRPREAGARLEANRDLYARFGRRAQLRRQWVEAKVAHGLGQFAEAERLYRESRDGLLGRRSGYDAALVSLDLARMYLEQGRSGEVRGLAEEMLPVFQSHDIHREAMEALRLFRDAARKEAASLDLVERITRYLEESRHKPDLPFEEVEG